MDFPYRGAQNVALVDTPTDRRWRTGYGSRDERPAAPDHPRDRGADFRHEAAERGGRGPRQRDQELQEGHEYRRGPRTGAETAHSRRRAEAIVAHAAIGDKASEVPSTDATRAP